MDEDYRKLASSVEREAQLILPSAKALVREHELGILNSMTVKMICPLMI